jgi:hypothetical protein
MSEEAAVNPQPVSRKKGFLRKSNMLLSLSAIFISAVTLFILIYQSSLATRQFELEQRQQLASTMPYLLIHNSNDTKTFSIEIRNFGLGPAFIEQVNVVYGDSTYQNYGFPAFVRDVLRPAGYANQVLYTGGLGEGHVIPANENFTHILFSRDSAARALQHDILYNDSAQLEIVYSSIYGEKWSTRGQNSKPKKLSGPRLE